jgi:hypothetical protein
MRFLYLLLYLIGAICFVVASFYTASVPNGTTTTAPPRPVARVNLVALGLFAWILVPLIRDIDLLND